MLYKIIATDLIHRMLAAKTAGDEDEYVRTRTFLHLSMLRYPALVPAVGSASRSLLSRLPA